MQISTWEDETRCTFARPAPRGRRAASRACSTWSTLRYVSDDIVTEIPIEAISANPQQPRLEFAEEELANLASSIRHDGLIQPLLVRQTAPGVFELIAGERRLRAASLAGLSHVPAVIRDIDDEALLRLALTENTQRVDLNPIEEARAYQELLDHTGVTQAELGDLVGKSRQWISHHLGLLKLPESVQRRVAAGVLSRGHAKALVGLADPAQAEALADRIVREGLTVRNVEEMILLGDVPRLPSSREKNNVRRQPVDFSDVSEKLGSWLDTRVKVQGNRTRGKIIVEFSSPDDLDRLLALMAEPAPRLLDERQAG